MGDAGLWVLGGVVLLVVAIVLEGKRQARVYGKPSGRPNLLGVGLLEVQRLLQPDRHVEVLMQQGKGEDGLPAGEEAGEGDRTGGEGGATPVRR